MADIYGNTVVVERAAVVSAAVMLRDRLAASGDPSQSISFLPVFIARMTNAWRSMHWAQQTTSLAVMEEEGGVSEQTIIDAIQLARSVRKSRGQDQSVVDKLRDQLDLLISDRRDQ